MAPFWGHGYDALRFVANLAVTISLADTRLECIRYVSAVDKFVRGQVVEDIARVNAAARLDSAFRRLEEIDIQIQSLTELRTHVLAEIEGLNGFLRAWHELAGMSWIRSPEQDIHHIQLPRPRPKNPDKEFVADQCVEIIRSARMPLSRRDLFQELAARGIVIEGKNPEMVLSTMLWRSKDKIVRFPNYGYWPADEQYPPAAYYLLADQTPDVFGVAAKEPEDGIEVDE